MSLRLLPFKEIELSTLDMHRWVACQAESEDRATVMHEFSKAYGDFFAGKYGITVSEPAWNEEWEKISYAVQFSNTDVIRASRLVEEGMSLHTSAKIVSRQQRGRGTKRGVDVAINPENWAGWCYGLIARDMADGITYKQCANQYVWSMKKSGTGVIQVHTPCQREVPNRTPTGATGRSGLKFCTAKCKSAQTYGARTLADVLKTTDPEVIKQRKHDFKKMNEEVARGMADGITYQQLTANIKKAIEQLEGEDNEKT